METRIKKRIITSLLIIINLIILNHVSANKVDLNFAKKIAMNFYFEHNQSVNNDKAFTIIDSYEITEDTLALLYVFNFSNNGFVMVAADDIIHPILAYSNESNYSDLDQSPQFTDWIGMYKKQISEAIKSGFISNQEIDQEWKYYTSRTENVQTKENEKSPIPLLYSKWNQGDCYNTLCPVDASGPGGHVWAGCVATAMAQVLYYYRFPKHGNGSHSYSSSSYGTLSANFGATTYDWNAMTLSCDNDNNSIATLLYQCGVSVNMIYSPTGSSAVMTTALNALKTYFNFSDSIQLAYKDNFSVDSLWENILKNEIDNKRPMIYAGYGSTGGHAWVCDGYQGANYFHFNWGWSGAGNGYFYLNALNPMGIDYSLNQRAIYNIYPKDNYPEYCSNTQIFTSTEGSIEDGSGPLDYNNYNDCQWLISPIDSVSNIKMNFIYLNTEPMNDSIIVYDGNDTTSPILGVFSGDSIPPQLISSGSKILIRFITNDSITSDGWLLTFTSTLPVFCTGITTLTEPSDTFSDGSGAYNYNNGSNCQWMIKPSNAAQVTLHFLDFNTENINDKVRIIDPVSSTTIATYSGSSIPPDVTSSSGQMKIMFNSNSTTTSSGWTAYYTSSMSDMDEYNLIKNISVFPNPVSDLLTVFFDNTLHKKFVIELINNTGQVVYSEESINKSSTVSKQIDMSRFSSGIYVVHIKTETESGKKIIIVE